MDFTNSDDYGDKYVKEISGVRWLLKLMKKG
jgi:hypothetical protein